MRFGSVCSGIEAASVAWHPLGWRAAWLAEIEPFPSAVLAHHYPDIPNLGDMTLAAESIALGLVEAPDMLCGGTPCQAFSVAGLRESLDDARGNLSLTFCEIANAIDTARDKDRKKPCVIMWENVPGVLNTKDNAFGCFLAGLAGEDDPLVAPGGKWPNAGAVFGPQRAVAWRVLDAQYFGVAQRRRRVFVVASAREGFDPAAVLFEFDGVRRDTAPSREAGKAAPTIPSRSTAGGGLGTDFDCDGGIVSIQGNLIGRDAGGPVGVGVGVGGPMFTLTKADVHGVAHSLRGEGFDASEDGTGRGTPLVPVVGVDGYNGALTGQVAATMGTRGSSETASGPQVMVPVPFDTTQITSKANFSNPKPGDPCHPLAAGAPAIAFHPTQDPIVSTDGTTHCMGTGSSQGGATVAVAVRTANTSANGHGISEELAHTLDRAQGQAVAHAIGWSEELTASVDVAGTIQRGGDGGRHDGVMTPAMQVRRLTPVECERLQGFPDGYTAIPWRGKPADQCPDGPRYKALGNSWAVPNARWIGWRIANELAKDLT